jgi:hypothetical protein
LKHGLVSTFRFWSSTTSWNRVWCCCYRKPNPDPNPEVRLLPCISTPASPHTIGATSELNLLVCYNRVVAGTVELLATISLHSTSFKSRHPHPLHTTTSNLQVQNRGSAHELRNVPRGHSDCCSHSCHDCWFLGPGAALSHDEQHSRSRGSTNRQLAHCSLLRRAGAD